jgi:hypothetical protein
VGVDRSDPSLTALHLAADVVQLLGGSLSVLEVIEYVPPFPLGPSTAVTSAGEEQAPARAMASSRLRSRQSAGAAWPCRSSCARESRRRPCSRWPTSSTWTSWSWGRGAGVGRPSSCWAAWRGLSPTVCADRRSWSRLPRARVSRSWTVPLRGDRQVEVRAHATVPDRRRRAPVIGSPPLLVIGVRSHRRPRPSKLARNGSGNSSCRTGCVA